jgi:hypothetical protein
LTRALYFPLPRNGSKFSPGKSNSAAASIVPSVPAACNAGGVVLTRIAGSMFAHALNGKLKVSLVGVGPKKPMSFSSLNGDIEVSLPVGIRANVLMKSTNGEIYSGFDIRMDTQARQNELSDDKSGKHAWMGSTMKGTINGGGPEIHFETFNRNIYIRKSSK